MIIFGLRSSNIGPLEIENSQCGYFENKGTYSITDFGRYFHIFWIPIFPLERETLGACNHCKSTIRKKEFDHELRKSYAQNKFIIKRPVWHWLGVILLGRYYAKLSSRII